MITLDYWIKQKEENIDEIIGFYDPYLCYERYVWSDVLVKIPIMPNGFTSSLVYVLRENGQEHFHFIEPNRELVKFS